MVIALALSACSSRLDVTNPNYFTDDQINDILNGTDATKKALVLSGIINTLPSYIIVSDNRLAGGFSNSDANEWAFERKRVTQAGDMVEGSAAHNGTYYRYYSNDPTLTYWEYDQNSENMGYYYGPVIKINQANKGLQYLTDVKDDDALLRGYRAKCLTVKAMGYMELMERYTDLQDVTSTTDQGWPFYDTYAYNDPVEPKSVADSWTTIKAMLTQAVADFKASNSSTSGYTVGLTTDDCHDVDAGVANYMLARVALDMKDWSTCITAATDLLSHYPSLIAPNDYGMDESKLASVVKRNANGWAGSYYNASSNAFYNVAKNPEIIFGSVGGSSNFSAFNTLWSSPAGYYQIDANIYNQMSNNDCRKACFLSSNFADLPVYSVNKTDTTWYDYEVPKYTSLKWAATAFMDKDDGVVADEHTTANSKADFVYMRSSAVLLMLAEAYAQSNQASQAKATLNKLLAARTKTGATTMTCDNTMAGKSALDMVKLQWRIEMWGEGDWAFYNQKRWNETPSRGANHWSTATVSHYTWEIPEIERQGNPYWK